MTGQAAGASGGFRKQDEENVAAQEAAAGESARLSATDVDTGRPQSIGKAQGEGAEPADRNGGLSRCDAYPCRLTRRQAFQRVYDSGRRSSVRWVTVRWLAGPCPKGRVGFSISRKAGKAVVRNRLRRRLREIVRQLARRGEWPGGTDVVLVARPGAAQASFEELRDSVERAMKWVRQACVSE